MHGTKTVGAYEAKTTLPALLALVSRGREVIITKHEKPVARLVCANRPLPPDKAVFGRIRSLRDRITLGHGESARELMNEGRRL